MPTTQRMESASPNPTPEIKPSLILMVDFNPLDQMGERLERQLRAMPTPLAGITRESLHGVGVAEAVKRISAVVASGTPGLLILLLADNVQAFAPSIFRALLGPMRCPPIIVVPGSEDSSAINELYRLGASDYLIPPFRAADVHPRVQRLLAYGYGKQTNVAALKEALGLKQFVGDSPALMEQMKKIPQLARCDASALITGETGTGKEICARVIHYLSRRADHPFVPLNCGAIPIDLLENELFGHETGAFTSAHAPHAGVICEAEGGTLFLDEIDSLPLPAQVKLLRFLQEGEYRPLGGRTMRKANVRVIAASNARLEELVAAGKVRQDFFFRLNVLPLHLPPLRQRMDDIPLLARHFLAKHASRSDTPPRDLAPDALRKLSRHDWPGNVRELEHVIERAVVLCEGEVVSSAEIDLPVEDELPAKRQSLRQLKAQVVEDFERNYLVNVLHEHHGNIARAARAAQKNRRVFFRLMNKYHIRVERLTATTDAAAVVKIAIAPDKNVHPSISP